MFLHVSVILPAGVVVWQTPWADIPQVDTPSGQTTPPPPPVTATVADGTHPTGMHSC